MATLAMKVASLLFLIKFEDAPYMDHLLRKLYKVFQSKILFKFGPLLLQFCNWNYQCNHTTLYTFSIHCPYMFSSTHHPIIVDDNNRFNHVLNTDCTLRMVNNKCPQQTTLLLKHLSPPLPASAHRKDIDLYVEF